MAREPRRRRARAEGSGTRARDLPEAVKEPEARPLEKVTVTPGSMEREARDWLTLPNLRLALARTSVPPVAVSGALMLVVPAAK